MSEPFVAILMGSDSDLPVSVASVAIGTAGAKNAAYLAAQILALASPALGDKLWQERSANADTIMAKNAALQEQLKG